MGNSHPPHNSIIESSDIEKIRQVSALIIWHCSIYLNVVCSLLHLQIYRQSQKQVGITQQYDFLCKIPSINIQFDLLLFPHSMAHSGRLESSCSDRMLRLNHRNAGHIGYTKYLYTDRMHLKHPPHESEKCQGCEACLELGSFLLKIVKYSYI